MSENPYEAPQAELGPVQRSPLAAIPYALKVLVLVIMFALEIYWSAHITVKLFDLLDLPPPTWLTARGFRGEMVPLFLVNGWMLWRINPWK